MQHDPQDDPSGEAPTSSESTAGGAESDGLLDRIELIESQPLDRRAQGFEQLHDELLAELQRSDTEGA
ncbi:hypothetical protein [Leucobacter aridicollis]|uniref:Uncharacterized protein n=1 Tax=Leucobacter aridicollis TaxID=283878 RepID=A0A852R3V2_9MICO|nr:hypothetical protein [Leucobacter aridicollis]MBL3682236.1 hypothetical protein [Leucobacter aridicollis]NYD25648.1 hypothetical protein [Leucobacter aridicollis]